MAKTHESTPGDVFGLDKLAALARQDIERGIKNQ